MRHVHDDGGREAAGFRGDTSDCVTRSIAIATGRPYREVYDLVNDLSRDERPRDGRRSSARLGVFKPTTRKVMQVLGWTWTPTMEIGRAAVSISGTASFHPGGSSCRSASTSPPWWTA